MLQPTACATAAALVESGSCARPPPSPRRLNAPVELAVGETLILLHPPSPPVGVAIGMERGCQLIDSLDVGQAGPTASRSRAGAPRGTERRALNARTEQRTGLGGHALSDGTGTGTVRRAGAPGDAPRGGVCRGAVRPWMLWKQNKSRGGGGLSLGCMDFFLSVALPCSYTH